MRELLIALILSFLVFLNIRLWSVCEFSFQDGWRCGRVTCDMPIDTTEIYDIEFECDEGDQLCEESVCAIQASMHDLIAPHEEVPLDPVVIIEMQNQGNVDNEGEGDTGYCGLENMSIDDIFTSYIPQARLSEVSIHQLIQLIANEMNLIECMLYPTAGSIHKAIRDRKRLVGHAFPSIQIIFDTLLSVATQHPIVDRKMQSSMVFDDKNMHKLLNREDKKLFLHTVYQRLSDMKKQLHTMQYRAALRSFGCSL